MLQNYFLKPHILSLHQTQSAYTENVTMHLNYGMSKEQLLMAWKCS